MQAAPLTVPDGDRDQLEKWVRSSSTKAGLVLRARIVLLAADGVAHAEIARRFSISRQTVINWRARYQSGGVAGLFDEDRSGRPRTLDREQLISVTLASPPRKYGVTHWSSRLLATHLGVGYSTVARVWRDHGIQPWRAETFKFSTDPELVAKVTDVVGLYLDPPENAIVLCVDEKSQIQALDRTAPTLPMQIGMPERQTHDYLRNGTALERSQSCSADSSVMESFAPTTLCWSSSPGHSMKLCAPRSASPIAVSAISRLTPTAPATHQRYSSTPTGCHNRLGRSTM
jgi:transposase